MGIFHRIGNAFARFMYGRNGTDQLNIAILIAYFVIFLARAVGAYTLQSRLFVTVFSVLLDVLFVLLVFRTFSRNLPKRRAENQKLMGWLIRTRSKQAGARQRHADKDHKYFTCKTCGTICRVPVGKGKVEITCPKCGAKIYGKT